MRSILALTLATFALASCGDSRNDTTTTTTDTAASVVAAPMPETTATTTTTTTASRAPMEGDVTYSTGKVRVYRNNAWVDADNDVKLEHNIVVHRSNGHLMRDNDEYELEDGYVVDREGNVWDRTGNAISDAWDATKHGVKKAGKAIGNAAEKVGDKAKDAVH